MNHASAAVAPPHAEVVQAGDAIWQRAKRRSLVHCPPFAQVTRSGRWGCPAPPPLLAREMPGRAPLLC